MRKKHKNMLIYGPISLLGMGAFVFAVSWFMMQFHDPVIGVAWALGIPLTPILV